VHDGTRIASFIGMTFQHPMACLAVSILSGSVALSLAACKTSESTGAGGSSATTSTTSHTGGGGQGGCASWESGGAAGSDYACGADQCILGEEVCIDSTIEGMPGDSYACVALPATCVSYCEDLGALMCGANAVFCDRCPTFDASCILECRMP
jgi:hypothetical protein